MSWIPNWIVGTGKIGEGKKQGEGKKKKAQFKHLIAYTQRIQCFSFPCT